MNNYILFRYISGDSKIHTLNSKHKIIITLLGIISSILLKDIISCLILLLFITYLILLSKINVNAYIKNVVKFWPIYILLFILGYIITFNILKTCYIIIKLIFILLFFMILTYTTSLSEIAWGIECLLSKLKKYKVPVSKIALRTATNIKFISTMSEQFYNIRKSMAYRGISYSRSKINTFRKMFIPCINISYKISKRTIFAMKLRFYGSSKNRTNYHENKESKFSRFLIILSALVLYFTILLGWIL